MQTVAYASEEAAGLTDLSRFLMAIGDPIRQQILMLLARERLNVRSLTERIHLSRPAISHQLKVLLDAGLLEQEAAGRERFYRVRAERCRSFVGDLAHFVDRLDGGA